MRKLVLTVVVLALAVPAFAQGILWDNGGPGAEYYCASSQNATNYPFRSGVADDFYCGDDPVNDICVITDIHWWGCYWNGVMTDPQGFEINIYNDAGGMPTGAGLPNPNVTAIASVYAPRGTYSETLWQTDRYEYDLILDEPIYLDCNEYYWLEIVIEENFPPQWGWEGTDGVQGAGAQQGFPALGLNYWTPLDPVTDMAFYITGYCIPEPGALSLLAIGGLALLRRR